ncbi:hypothetical protein GGTG_13809 [Gaeumannomyces tritici R3-111a-1]|uniref:Chromo domain-containing protein n=1 Tax=Gaeumannomyces tritici (strain R3-111a-1) TaxID=644352 RepID=J3PJW8_GAET3|nr:hypothetical protein GGTG_13809 [Gaeumannomyces tritici R3-111a-1]EJT68619.1 hypothetical protein GGTG_13809 [Gaeumannomyces tritici R3-111a-1]
MSVITIDFVTALPTTSKRTMILPRYNRLRKSPNDPLPQQHQEPEPPEDINGEPEWEVDMVLASRVTGKAKKLQYQVSWKGCDPDDQWYLAENFKNAAIALEAFHLNTQRPQDRQSTCEIGSEQQQKTGTRRIGTMTTWQNMWE